MAKQSGLGQRLLVGGYDISGDVQALDNVHGGPAALDVTDITQSAHARIGGLRDGGLGASVFMDTANAHPVLDALPRTDVVVSYLMSTTFGDPAACLVAKQLTYDPTRGADGSLMLKTQFDANGYGLEWGVALTSGVNALANSLTGASSTFEASVGNWVALTNCAVADTAAQHHGGADSMSMTSSASGDMVSESAAAGSYATQMFAVTPGQQVSVQAWVRSAVSVRTCSVGVHWFTSGGSSVSTTYGSGVADSTSAWTLIPATVVAPATAAFGCVSVKVASTGASNEVHYVDDAEAFLLPGVLNRYPTGTTAFGAQAYLQVTAFTGTDVTVKIQQSADNVSWSDLITFTQVTAAPASQRVAVSNTTSVFQYVQAIVTTAGGFTALSFSCAISINPIAGQVF